MDLQSIIAADATWLSCEQEDWLEHFQASKMDGSMHKQRDWRCHGTVVGAHYKFRASWAVCLFRAWEDTRFLHNGDLIRIFHMDSMGFIIARNIDFHLRKEDEPAGKIINHMAVRDLQKDTMLAFRHSAS